MTAEQRAQMRARILDAARERFLEGGLDGLSMRGIASKVGVSSMTLYLYYDSRQDIIRHIVAEGFTLLNRALEEAIKGGHTSDRIERFGKSYIGFAGENPRYYAAMFQYLADTREEGPDEVVSGPSSRAMDLLRGAVVDVSGEPEGAEKRAATVWCALHGLSMLTIGGQLEPHGVKTEDVRSLIANAGPWL
jgi:AcrR family transcriptional regulator